MNLRQSLARLTCDPILILAIAGVLVIAIAIILKVIL
jgi:hypothetical protein